MTCYEIREFKFGKYESIAVSVQFNNGSDFDKKNLKALKEVFLELQGQEEDKNKYIFVQVSEIFYSESEVRESLNQ